MSDDHTTSKTQQAAGESASCSIDTQETVSERWRKHVWGEGAYEEVAPAYVPMAGRLVEATDVGPEDDVVDIGCGTGTVAITAARRGADVTGLDIQPALLKHARTYAEIAAADVSWREGDATTLPFDTNAFDVALSNLGHMYGDPPDSAASELLRVTRPGGQVGFTSWTPTSLYPAMAGVAMTFLSPEQLPDFSEPPFLWGDSSTVEERLGSGVDNLTFETDDLRYRAVSPEHFLQETLRTSGMFTGVLEGVEDEDVPRLHEQLTETIERYFEPEENVVTLEYQLTTASVAASVE